MPESFLNADFVSSRPDGSVTGDKDLDALINQTLRRDSDTRPSLAEMLRKPIFRRDGVGKIETRKVIAALATNPPKTADEIKALAADMKA